MGDAILFYRAAGEWGFLSNLWRVPVRIMPPRSDTLVPLTFRSAEDAYQYAKPRSKDIADWLIAAPKPHLCAAAAHALLGFDVRPDWQAVKVEWMRAVVYAKFRQHLALAWKLIGTGARELIEESTTDAFWGIGRKGTGKNMLGVLLTETRATLRAELCASPASLTSPQGEEAPSKAPSGPPSEERG